MFAHSRSQASQDLFVICALNGKRDGAYVEIGACVPVEGNNTYLLESKFGWKGVSFEILPHYVDEFNKLRRNVCVQADATTVDLVNIVRLADLGPHFDYLQVDIEPPGNTLKALKNIDLGKLSFSVVTYEHDLYNGGHEERAESRRLLAAHGYTRVLSDVKYDDCAFEDWWVLVDRMPNDNWKAFVGEGVNMDREKMPAFLREKIQAMAGKFLP